MKVKRMTRLLSLWVMVPVLAVAIVPNLATAGVSGPATRPDSAENSTQGAENLSLETLRKIAPMIKLNKRGLFTLKQNEPSEGNLSELEYWQAQSYISGINCHIARLDRSERPFVANSEGRMVWNSSFKLDSNAGDVQLLSTCVFVPKWAVEAFIIGLMAANGVNTAIGVVVSSPLFILGVPAPIVIGILGVSNEVELFLLWKACEDNYPSPGRTFCF